MCLKKKNISIKEIASLCNVSVATVSRVINDNGRFSEETRKKVLDVIKQYDYKINMVAKSLRTNKSQSIGVLVPNINNEFFSNIVLEIEKYFFPKGYSVFICNTNSDEKREKEYLKDLDVKGVDGLIYISGMENIPADSLKRKIPMVCIDRNLNINQEGVIVESDNKAGGFLATQELIKKGCRNILILKSYKDFSTSQQRFDGYKDALEKNNLLIKEQLIANVNITVEGAKQAVNNLIEQNIKFDGIFACNDFAALGSLIALKEHKISVPQQVKIVGFDNISISQYSYPAISTINQDKKKLGQEASEALLNLINENSIKRHHIVLPVSLVVRETT
jgi:LacI family transcriptional regulator